MFKLLPILLLPLTVYAQTVSLKVTNVTPNYRTITEYHTIIETKEVCYRVNESNGVLERIVDGSFGSTEGFVGTAAGAAIGDVIGGGGDNTAVKIIGGVIGNKVGNNIADKKRNTCEYIDVERKEPYNVQVISDYNVTVNFDGQPFTVRRPYQPKIGQRIEVDMRAN